MNNTERLLKEAEPLLTELDPIDSERFEKNIKAFLKQCPEDGMLAESHIRWDSEEREFDILWEKTLPLDIALINKYAQRLNFAIERWDMDYDLASHEIKPNFMQRKALRELNRYRAMGQDKSLVVAATGSGKTYLAAFDALNFSPEHLLYIVHEGSILKRSLSTFQTVFGGDVFIWTHRSYSQQTFQCVGHWNCLTRNSSTISSLMNVIMPLLIPTRESLTTLNQSFC